MRDYYKKGEVDSKLDNYYNKAQIDDKFKNYYTKSEIDSKLKGYIINKTPQYQLGLGYDGIKLHAYNNTTEIPLSTKTKIKLKLGARQQVPENADWIAPADGMIIYTGRNSCANPWGVSKRLVYVNNFELADLSEGSHGEANVNLNIPVTKGDTIRITNSLVTSLWYGYGYFYPYDIE